MANDPSTVVTESYRESAITNLDNLGARRKALEDDMREVERAHAKALADALAPLEAQMRDCNQAIYATERTLGALPPVESRFQERDGSGDGQAERPEAPESGLSETEVNG